MSTNCFPCPDDRKTGQTGLLAENQVYKTEKSGFSEGNKAFEPENPGLTGFQSIRNTFSSKFVIHPTPRVNPHSYLVLGLGPHGEPRGRRAVLAGLSRPVPHHLGVDGARDAVVHFHVELE